MGCRRVAPPAELVRLVRTPDGHLAVGRTLPGRGVWVCAGSSACFDQAVRRRVLNRALRGAVSQESIERARSSIEAAG